MLTVPQIVQKYISFFKERDHIQIPNAPLVPQNDPTTLFTSAGMQPLVPYLLGEQHPQGKRLVNVQNSFRAQDINEIGDNRHTTFFRMLGNWSLGDYFKKEQLPWFFEFLTKELGLNPKRFYVSVFSGYQDIPKDTESETIWKELFEQAAIDPKGRIFHYGVDENWWSRSGEPQHMPTGEPGGPDTEVFFDFYPDQGPIGTDLKKYSHNGRLLEIGNSVFMEYKKTEKGFLPLPKKNVDFGGGLERLLAAVEDKQDMFQTSLFSPIIKSVEKITGDTYSDHQEQMRIITDHLIAAVFIANSGITPSNKEQGYILRRLVRRSFDNINQIRGMENMNLPTREITESIITQYKDADPDLVTNFEKIVNTILEETNKYKSTISKAQSFIKSKYKLGDELKGLTEISADDAFLLYTTHGLSPMQIKSLGYIFDEQAFAQKMKEHQGVSRKGASQKFAGGLADTQEKTIMGHTATHLLHQALRDVLGPQAHQTGSNITTERIRFDFNYDRKLTNTQIEAVERIVNEKIEENLPVHFEMMPLQKAKDLGAIGLFDEKYQDTVKVYFIGGLPNEVKRPYSVEFCGGPHVEFTGKLKSFKIIKQENIGNGQKRVYAIVE